MKDITNENIYMVICPQSIDYHFLCDKIWNENKDIYFVDNPIIFKSLFKHCITKKTIERAARKYKKVCGFNEIIELLEFSEDLIRAEQPWKFLGNDRWIYSVALGLAQGKKYFCMPWMDKSVMKYQEYRNYKIFQAIKKVDAKIIFPIEGMIEHHLIIDEDIVVKNFEELKEKKLCKEALVRFEEKKTTELPERVRGTAREPYMTGLNEGEVYSFQIKKEIEDNKKYVGWYVLLYIDKIVMDDWDIKGIQDEVIEGYFFLVEEEPKDVRMLEYATPICFKSSKYMGNQYRMNIFESSITERPPDLKLIGNCVSFSYPDCEYFQNGTFFWETCEKEIIRSYDNQLTIEGESRLI